MSSVLTFKDLSGKDWYILKEDANILSSNQGSRDPRKANILPRGSIVVAKDLNYGRTDYDSLTVHSYDSGMKNIRCKRVNLARLNEDDIRWLLPINDPRLRYCVYYNKDWWTERLFMRIGRSITYIKNNADMEATIIDVPNRREAIMWIRISLKPSLREVNVTLADVRDRSPIHSTGHHPPVHIPGLLVGDRVITFAQSESYSGKVTDIFHNYGTPGEPWVRVHLDEPLSGSMTVLADSLIKEEALLSVKASVEYEVEEEIKYNQRENNENANITGECRNLIQQNWYELVRSQQTVLIKNRLAGEDCKDVSSDFQKVNRDFLLNLLCMKYTDLEAILKSSPGIINSLVSFSKDTQDLKVIIRQLDDTERCHLRNVLLNSQSKIENCLEIQDIVDIMFQNKDIECTAVKEIFENETRKDRTRCLVARIMENRDDTLLCSFIETLRIFDKVSYKLIEHDIKNKTKVPSKSNIYTEILDKFRTQIIALFTKECDFLVSCLETGEVFNEDKMKILKAMKDPREKMNAIIDEIGCQRSKGFDKFVEILENFHDTNTALLLKQARTAVLDGKSIKTEIDQDTENIGNIFKEIFTKHELYIMEKLRKNVNKITNEMVRVGIIDKGAVLLNAKAIEKTKLLVDTLAGINDDTYIQFLQLLQDMEMDSLVNFFLTECKKPSLVDKILKLVKRRDQPKNKTVDEPDSLASRSTDVQREPIKNSKSSPVPASECSIHAQQHKEAVAQQPKPVQSSKSVVPPPTAVNPKSIGSPFEIDSLVEVQQDGVATYGVVRWMGYFGNPNKISLGIECEYIQPKGNDGTFGGYRLFKCPPKRGLFVASRLCAPDTRFLAEIGIGMDETPIIYENTCPEYHLGKEMGIQGHHNSCYIDATLFSMFAYNQCLDFLLNEQCQTSTQEKIQYWLRCAIVNPLRSKGAVHADRITELRTKLAALKVIGGLTNEEKDPEEFLRTLLSHALGAEQFIELSHKQGEFMHQLMGNRVNDVIPTTQKLFNLSVLHQGICFLNIPRCLILQMPRSGKALKMYKCIFPSPKLTIKDATQAVTPDCVFCGHRSTKLCAHCSDGSELVDERVHAAFCTWCCEQRHKDETLPKHHDIRPISTRPSSTEPIQSADMELFAVLCIETSHYVAFVKTEKHDRPTWLFFDSMADREGSTNGFNIPEVKEVEDICEWLTEKGYSDLKHKVKKGELVERFFGDPYMCFYRPIGLTNISKSFYQTCM